MATLGRDTVFANRELATPETRSLLVNDERSNVSSWLSCRFMHPLQSVQGLG